MRKALSSVVAVLLLSAGVCLAGDPVVSNVRAQQRGGGSKLVDIYYDVADSDGDRLTVGVALTAGGTAIPATSLGGAVGSGVAPGSGKQIVWDAGADWAGQFSENVRVSVTADDGRTGSGQYMVIDLSGGPSASSYPVSYLSAVPSGGWSDTYKTTKLVMRRIPKGSFTMGSPSGELGRYSDETQHPVTLTKDFYIGVFEVTQAQYTQVMGSNPSQFEGSTRPVECVSYYMIRGSGAGAGWPASSAVDADSFLGRLRARTGLDFDLPTEAQWEYACRAGTTTEYCNGDTENDLKQVGRYDGNGGESSQHAVVGSYQPNAWGLYDMHGNVWEWCLDRYDSLDADSATDPVGAASGRHRVSRGGSWSSSAQNCRSASRNNYDPSYSDDNILGFRLVASPGR